MKNKNEQKISTWVLIVIFLCFIALPIFLMVQDINTKNSMDSYTFSHKTTYKIKRSKTNKGHYHNMYAPIYHYNIEGKEYTCTSNFSQNKKPSQKPIKIYYQSYSKEDCFPDEGIKNVLFYLLIISLGTIGFIGGIKQNIEH